MVHVNLSEAGPTPDPDELDRDVERLTRVVTACGLLDEKESVLEELDGRVRSVRQQLWPEEDPLRGYGQQCSVGAFVVARYAVAWVPSGLATSRHSAQTPEGLVRAFMAAGLSEAQAGVLLAGFEGTEDSQPTESELDFGVLAGLAERSLTQTETKQAMARVAWSPRDTARLAAAARLVDRVRAGLPWMPIDRAAAGLAVAAADVPERQPERRFRLLRRSTDPWLRLLSQLAEAEATLRRTDGTDLARLVMETEQEPDTADLPERDTHDIMPPVRPEDLDTSPQSACLGLRPRHVDLSPHVLPAADLSEGALMASVRALRLAVMRAADGKMPPDLKSEFWTRRVKAIAIVATGKPEQALAELHPDDPEARWADSCRLRGGWAVTPSDVYLQAAELLRDITASVLAALGGSNLEPDS